MSDERARDLEHIRETYRAYDHDDRAGSVWDIGNPGFARIVGDRDRRLLELIDQSLSETSSD